MSPFRLFTTSCVIWSLLTFPHAFAHPPGATPNEQIRINKKEGSNKCTYCMDALQLEHWTCSSCEATLHLDCFKDNEGQCTTLGCEKNRP